MFAVIKTGGKQYKVAQDEIFSIEKLDAKVGDTVTLTTVIMVGDKVGTPFVSGASVSLQVLEQKKDDKVIVFKKKRRQNYRRKNGHRQNLSVVKVTGIKA